MKAPDLASTVVAALIGAGAVLLIGTMIETELTTAELAGIGAATGAIVQIGIRLTGVS